jgi:hypothetical protein
MKWYPGDDTESVLGRKIVPGDYVLRRTYAGWYWEKVKKTGHLGDHWVLITTDSYSSDVPADHDTMIRKRDNPEFMS